MTVVFPEVHFLGYVVDERAIVQGMAQTAPHVNPVTGNIFPVTQPLSPADASGRGHALGVGLVEALAGGLVLGQQTARPEQVNEAPVTGEGD
jgi:hypothetical protein